MASLLIPLIRGASPMRVQVERASLRGSVVVIQESSWSSVVNASPWVGAASWRARPHKGGQVSYLPDRRTSSFTAGLVDDVTGSRSGWREGGRRPKLTTPSKMASRGRKITSLAHNGENKRLRDLDSWETAAPPFTDTICESWLDPSKEKATTSSNNGETCTHNRTGACQNRI